MIARCPHCRFLFEGGTPGLLPACPQCHGVTVAVIRIEASKRERDAPTPPRTLKFGRPALPQAR